MLNSEKRLVFMSPPGAPAASAPSEPDQSKEQLSALEAELRVEQSDVLARVKKENVDFSKWVTNEWGRNAANDAKLAAEIKKALIGITKPSAQSGVDVMIDALKAGPNANAKKYKDAYETLERIVNTIQRHEEVMAGTREQYNELKPDIPLGGPIRTGIDNVTSTWTQLDGTGKVAACVMAYFLARPFLSKETGNKESIIPGFTWKELLGWGGFALAANYGVGMLTGKTALEHVGFSKPQKDLPAQARALAERSGIKDPAQFGAMASLGSFGPSEMKAWYQDYLTARKGNKKINPEGYPYNLFDLSDNQREVFGKTLFELMDEMMTIANNGKEPGKEDNFRRRYLDTSETAYNFTLIAADIMAKTNTTVAREVMGEDYIRDLETQVNRFLVPALRKYKTSDFKAETIQGADCQISLKGVAAKYAQMPDGIWKLILPSGEVVIINPNAPDADLQRTLQNLDKLVEKDVRKRLARQPKLSRLAAVPGGLTWRSPGQWVLKDVETGGRKQDAVVIPSVNNADDFVLRIGTLNLESNAVTLEAAHENATYQRVIMDYKEKPFDGTKVKVTSVQKQSGQPTNIAGTIEGVPFKARYDETNKELVMSGSDFEYAAYPFINKKAEIVSPEARDTFEKLAKLAGDANEKFVSAAFWESPGMHGSVDEAFWGALIHSKFSEALNFYKVELQHATSPEHVMQADKSLKEMARKMETIYTRIEADVSSGREITGTDFQSWVHDVDNLPGWYGNPEYKDFMVDIRTFLQKQDFSGWGEDSYKVFQIVYARVSDATSELALVPGPLDAGSKRYLLHVKGEVEAFIKATEKDKASLWKGTETLFEAFPVFGSRPAAYWTGDVWSRVDEKVTAPDVDRFLRMKSYRTFTGHKPPVYVSHPRNSVEIFDGKLTDWGAYNKLKAGHVLGTSAFPRGVAPTDLSSSAPDAMTAFTTAIKEKLALFNAQALNIATLPNMPAQEAKIKEHLREILNVYRTHFTPAAFTRVETAMASVV